MYKDDHTIIKLGNMEQKTEVTGGIRQGCCLSTLLFKMVTFKIIDELRKEKLFKFLQHLRGNTTRILIIFAFVQTQRGTQ